MASKKKVPAKAFPPSAFPDLEKPVRPKVKNYNIFIIKNTLVFVFGVVRLSRRLKYTVGIVENRDTCSHFCITSSVGVPLIPPWVSTG